MERTLVFDSQINWTHAAVIEHGRLVEIHRERSKSKDPTESLYLGRVQQIRPSLCAAFVDIGEEQNAFLPLDENEHIRCGDMILVQGAAKQSVDSKGLRITRKINLAGKSLVLLPGGSGVHVSKKIKDDDIRKSLKQFGESFLPPDFGMIIRTVSADMTEQFLLDEMHHLIDLWDEIHLKAESARTPGILWARPSLCERMIRDLCSADMASIVTNSEEQYAQLMEWQRQGIIHAHVMIDYHNESSQLIFDAYDIESQIDKALKRRIWLPCGGYLVFDSCEAMTVIDVNSGKMTLGKNIEETALRVNLEAASEIARQIRLRNTGGMIVADFIDMSSAEHRNAVLQKLSEEVRHDRNQVTLLGYTQLGFMEMTRKRTSDELRKQMRVSCSTCSGTGEILSGEETAVRILQQIRRMVISGQRGPFLVKCANAVADPLSGMINPLESVEILVSSSCRHNGKFDIEQISSSDAPQGAVALRKRKEI